MTVTLQEGQYQIGELLFGAGTPIRVTTFAPGGYDVNIRDRNIDLTDEVSYGLDTLTPQPIAFELAVLDNYDIRYGPGHSVAGWPSGMSILELLKMEWRADRQRKVWNSHKALRYKKNGPAKVIFGRPRKLTESKTRRGGEFIPVVCEFMPADTLAYSDQIFTAQTVANVGTITRENGEGDAWVQFLIEGPVTNPKVVVDDLWEWEIDATIGSGKFLEVNSSPWQRRIVDSDSHYLSAKLIGDSAYLGDMKIPPHTSATFTFSGTGTDANTKCVATWREAYLAY